jgi:hypothetical protein
MRTPKVKTQSAGQMEIATPDLNDVAKHLRDEGYIHVFEHIQGAGNIFTLWVNLSTGDEVMTVSRPARGNYRGTELFRLSAITHEYLRECLGLEAVSKASSGGLNANGGHYREILDGILYVERAQAREFKAALKELCKQFDYKFVPTDELT